MYKKCLILLMAGMLIFSAGCGKQGNSVDATEESAVDSSTADSNTDNVESAKDVNDSNIVEEADPDEEYITAPGDLSCVIPKGFVEEPDEPGLYLHRTYPRDLASISHTIGDADDDITDISSDDFCQMMEDEFLEYYGDEVEIHISEFNRVKVDGRKGLRIKFEYEFKGQGYEVLTYYINNGENFHTLAFTQLEGDDWMDEFEECGETITFG